MILETPPDIALAYIGGLFENSGTVGFNKILWSRISHRDRNCLVFCKQAINKGKLQRATRGYRLSLDGHDCLIFLELIRPFVTSKRDMIDKAIRSHYKIGESMRWRSHALGERKRPRRANGARI